MQTPPDSDPEAPGYAAAEDGDEIAEILDSAVAGNHARHADIIKPRAERTAASNKERSMIRRQRITQRKPHTSDSANKVSLLVYKPTTATTRLRTELVTMLVRTQRNDTWFNLVPSRLGHSESVDCATKAIVKAQEHAVRNTAVSQESCLGSYSKAITTLRDEMEKSGSSDDTLLTVALLVTFERMFAWTSVPLRSHMHGIVAILMGQAKSSTAFSEMTRAVHYTFWPVAFIGPCVMGAPSPFESPKWLDAEPVVVAEDKMSTPWKIVARLRKLGNQLFIRLPRLIMLVKALQTQHDPKDVETTILLARDLLTVEDTDAENDLLHHVQITKVDSKDGVDVAQYSMNFRTMIEFEAAAHYWSTCIFLRRLCWRLLGLFPTKYHAHGLQSKSEIEASVSRMSSNILMMCHWGLGKGEASESCLILDLVAIWGSLNDFDVFAARGMSPAKARALLLQHGQSIMRPTGPDALEETSQRLNAAAELFSGGPSSGILAFTFRKPGPEG